MGVRYTGQTPPQICGKTGAEVSEGDGRVAQGRGGGGLSTPGSMRRRCPHPRVPRPPPEALGGQCAGWEPPRCWRAGEVVLPAHDLSRASLLDALPVVKRYAPLQLHSVARHRL